MQMNKYQLIQGMINDLGDENRGVQVRGFRNLKIISTTVEALAALKEGLARDVEAINAVIADKNAQIEKLKRQVEALGGKVEEPKEEPEPEITMEPAEEGAEHAD